MLGGYSATVVFTVVFASVAGLEFVRVCLTVLSMSLPVRRRNRKARSIGKRTKTNPPKAAAGGSPGTACFQIIIMIFPNSAAHLKFVELRDH